MAGTLLVVATPIGNLEDLSPRAIKALERAEVIYAEDTRRSRILLDEAGVSRPLRSLYEHNERARSDEVLKQLETGGVVALLTDAGTPGVSDPGAELVRRAAAAGHVVSPIPGPSALTTALSVAGFAAEEADVLFVGFLPAKGRERARAVARVAGHAGIVVLFEAPHRILATLEDLAAQAAGRAACLCRELTKIHEELRRGTVEELRQWAAADDPRGEITLVLGPVALEEKPADEAAIDAALKRCLEAGLSARDASTAVAAVLEEPRRRVYERCLKLR